MSKPDFMDWLEEESAPTEALILERDDYSVEKAYPYVADRVPRIAYVELAWLGYYTVRPVAPKAWDVTCHDGVVFHNHDRRTAVREAQTYVTALACGTDGTKHLPKPLRPVTYDPVTSGEPPF